MSSEELREGLADRLRAVRKQRGLTQTALAREAGITKGAVHHFEAATQLPNAANLLRLAGALNVSVDFLLGRWEEPPEAPGDRRERLKALLEVVSQLPDDDVEILIELARALHLRRTGG